MRGLIPFEKAIGQTTETMLLAPKTITAAHKQNNYKLTRGATIPSL